MEELEIKFTITELNVILKHLQEGKYIDVHSLISKIMNEYNEHKNKEVKNEFNTEDM